MKVVPLNDKLVVKRLEAEEKTAGGIVLPDTARKNPSKAKSQPRRRQAPRKRQSRQVPGQGGDRVLFTSYAGTKSPLTAKNTSSCPRTTSWR